MFRTRRRRWIAFAILAPALVLAIAARLVLAAANSTRSRFDRLEEGMTMAEASEVLGRDLSKDTLGLCGFGGQVLADCFFEEATRASRRAQGASVRPTAGELP
jgi:hypothetical protein